MKKLILVGLLVVLTLPLFASNRVTFRIYTVQHNEAFVTSMLPMGLWLIQVSGPPVKSGTYLNCKPVMKKMGWTDFENKKYSINQTHLLCEGKRDFIVKGISFEQGH